jgi:MoxR-like ATPase
MTADTAAQSAASADSESIHVSSDQIDELRDNVERVFRGKSKIVRLTVACLIARGHLLLEDVPGVGKTTLALAIAKSMGLSFNRVQFTSDLLPSDIIGVSVYSPKTDEFEFRPGPIFSNVVLADEINRTTPRTQSALLEAMSEGSVSVDNDTRELPSPFLVIATQNPLEHHGTYPLPESQLDRFLMRLSIGYPDREIERSILENRGLQEPVQSLEPVLDPGAFQALQKRAAEVRVEESIVTYLLDIIEATRQADRVRIGVSTRGGLSLTRAARALALVEGRDYVIPDDVHELVVPCLGHRLSLAESGRGTNHDEAAMILRDIMADVPPPT